MRLSKLLKKRKDNVKSRAERDFIKWQEGNRQKVMDIMKRAADEIEALGYFIQPTITLDPDQRISHSSGIAAKAALDLMPMLHEVHTGLMKEKREDEIRKGLSCAKCEKTHVSCTKHPSSGECQEAGIEPCSRCLAWAAEKNKKAKETQKQYESQEETAPHHADPHQSS